jgi:hypothetical protein
MSTIAPRFFDEDYLLTPEFSITVLLHLQYYPYLNGFE